MDRQQPPYITLPGKVIDDNRFKHVMALALDPQTSFKTGVVRCITNRTGDIQIWGYTDHSELHTIVEDMPGHFRIGDRLFIENEEDIIKELGQPHLEYLGLEDPDIWIDEQSGLTHLYFTIPFISKEKPDHHSLVHLGHAIGPNVTSLVMTKPVLQASTSDYNDAKAKEVSIAPINSSGVRFNLFEGHAKMAGNQETFSTVRVARARDMGTPWEFGPTVFHPGEHNLAWISGHASPGPLFSRDFVDVGKGKLLGIMNGREKSRSSAGKVIYGMFSVGLFIYDYEVGKIEWVSPEPLIQDPEAKTITFASQFIETGKGEGVLYAHVDDSFVRAYTLYASALNKLLP